MNYDHENLPHTFGENEDETMQTIEMAAQNASMVSPEVKTRKVPQKFALAGAIAICILALITIFTPDTTEARAENENTSGTGAMSNATLSQNLELIARMKAETSQIQAGLDSIQKPERITHPSQLAWNKKNSSKPNKEIMARMNAPTSFTLDGSGVSQAGFGATDAGETRHATLTGNNPNAQFVNGQDDIVSVSAKRLPHPDFTIPAGEMIPATLEVAINSELPGMVRALVSRDSYSLTGSNLLIPKGSTLVGQFNAGVIQGQSRLLVVWNRVQMPDGVIVTLNSPGTDTLGRAGMGADRIDHHFLARFGQSALLSILGAATANLGVNSQDQYNSAAQYRMGIAQSLQQSASQTLEQDMNIAPTLSIDQGARIHVFVAHDLDFAAVGRARLGQEKALTLAAFRGAVWK